MPHKSTQEPAERAEEALCDPLRLYRLPHCHLQCALSALRSRRALSKRALCIVQIIVVGRSDPHTRRRYSEHPG